MINTVNKSEQDFILKILQGLPPNKWFNDCNTQDRIDSWNKWKYFYSTIHDFLKAHFLGEDLPTETMSPDLKQVCGLYMDYYLALYAVISWGWKYIQEELAKLNENFPSKPGEMFHLILQSEAVGALVNCAFPEYLPSGNYYYEFSPRETYNFYKKSSKVERLRKGGNTLNEEDEILVEKHLKEVNKKKSEIVHYFEWLILCIHACEKAKSKDEILKNRLQDLSQKRGRLRGKIITQYHPRKTPSGHAVNKGVRLPGSKAGYRNISLQP